MMCSACKVLIADCCDQHGFRLLALETDIDHVHGFGQPRPDGLRRPSWKSADSYFRILERTDDVINVSGHRLGSKEIESAALTVASIAPGDDPGDVTTLANPESVKAIQKTLEKMHMQPDDPSGRSGTHPGPRP